MSHDEFDLVTEAEALRLIGGAETPISRATLWRGIRAGRYPKPIKIAGGSANRWLRRELVAVLRRALDERETAGA